MCYKTKKNLRARRRDRRRGLTSMLAMLFLVIFGSLAIGFYAATNTQSQIVANDSRMSVSQVAAESGMDFMRYQLGRVNIPSGTPSDRVIDELYTDLRSQLNGTPNLGSGTVSRSGNTITIPSAGSIALDRAGNASFRAVITDWAGEIVCKIEGNGGGLSSSRAITMDFTRANRPTSAFDYAVASKGQVVMMKGAVTSTTGVDPKIAKLMSASLTATAVNVSGGTIGGDLSYVDGGGVNHTSGSVGGSSIHSVIMADHVHRVDPPEFPLVNTDVFRPYAVNSWNGGSLLKNVRIPPHTNPSFAGGTTIQGILYIESPNRVEFRGNVQLQGFIVFENKRDSSANVIDMRGNFSHVPLPAGDEFDPLRSIAGIAVLAPTTNMIVSGSVDSTLRGNVIVGQYHNAGSADWTIDRGTLMTMDPGSNSAEFNGKNVKFTATGGVNMPTVGLVYSTYYQPDPQSYQEVTP